MEPMQLFSHKNACSKSWGQRKTILKKSAVKQVKRHLRLDLILLNSEISGVDRVHFWLEAPSFKTYKSNRLNFIPTITDAYGVETFKVCHLFVKSHERCAMEYLHLWFNHICLQENLLPCPLRFQPPGESLEASNIMRAMDFLFSETQAVGLRKRAVKRVKRHLRPGLLLLIAQMRE